MVKIIACYRYAYLVRPIPSDTITLIEIRRAMAEDISRVVNFYAERRYGGGVRAEDALLLAERDGELVGIVQPQPQRFVPQPN